MTEVFLDALKDSMRTGAIFVYNLSGGGNSGAYDQRKSQEVIRKAGRVGPIWGSVLGVFPQCGFSAAASYFYMGRVITLGTLIAVYMSTSDEMLPILISEKVPIETILKILGAKVLISMISGFVAEFLFGRFIRGEEVEKPQEDGCSHCSCASGIAAEAVRHTVKVFFFILIISLCIGAVIHFIGEEESVSALYRCTGSG